MQEYLLARLRDDAATPTIDELIDRIAHRSGGTLDLSDAAELVRADRDAR